MTTIEFYHSIVLDDDTEDWNLLDRHTYGSDFDNDLDNRIFNSPWEN